MLSLSTNGVATRALTGALALGAALSLMACGTDRATTSAESAPTIRQEILQPPQVATVLKRSKPLLRDTTVSVTLYNSGGSINIDPIGFHLNIPKPAVPTAKPLTISVTALAGEEVAYKFEPHGLVWKQPISATQELTNTTWAGNTGNTKLEIGYFPTDGSINTVDGTAVITEYFPATINATGNRVHWGVPHFSGYVIVTGRKPQY